MKLTADEFRARILLQAMLPPLPKAPPPASPETVKAGVEVVVLQDFMSDSGAQDKVLLKEGQVGVVKKLNDAGHASIDFEAHRKLQWVAKSHLHQLGLHLPEEPANTADDDVEYVSSFKRRMRAEFEEALEYSLQRRVKRMEQRLNLVRQQTGSGSVKPAPAAAVATPPQSEDNSSMDPLTKSLADALRSKPLVKAYGPSGTQERLADPPEKEEEAVNESVTLKLTLQSLEQNVAARRRQIASLNQQVATCQDLCRSMKEQADQAVEREKAIRHNAVDLRDVHREQIARQSQRVTELQRSVEKSEQCATTYRTEFRKQRRYLVQCERISAFGGRNTSSKHPAGDIALALQPLPFHEERPETWDVGTAIANPYNVDSWPFEPNVLARRTFHQGGTLEPFQEEDEDDLEEDKRRLRSFVPGLRLPRRDSEEHDDNEDYDGPTGTSRSF